MGGKRIEARHALGARLECRRVGRCADGSHQAHVRMACFLRSLDKNVDSSAKKCASHTESHTQGNHTGHTLGCLLTLGKTLVGVGTCASHTQSYTGESHRARAGLSACGCRQKHEGRKTPTLSTPLDARRSLQLAKSSHCQ